MKKAIKKIIALTETIAMIVMLCAGVCLVYPKQISAADKALTKFSYETADDLRDNMTEGTAVALSNWSFAQGGQYSLHLPNGIEPGNDGIISSVTMNGTNEKITGWLESGEASIDQTQSATQASTGFALGITRIGWDRIWEEIPYRMNPWSIQALMNDVAIEPGHTYTVSFKAYATRKKYGYLAFGCDVPGTTPYGEDLIEGSNNIMALTPTEQTFTYTFTNWVAAKKLNTTFMLGAFASQYDFEGNDVSDIVAETEDPAWNGIVYVRDFTITDKGLNDDYVVTPPEKETEPEKDKHPTEWSGFSVCYDPLLPEGELTEWEKQLNQIGYVRGVDYATEGWITPDSTASDVSYYVKNSGWDAQYDPYNGLMVGDNPYGATIKKTNITVEKGRYYYLSFKIKSTLANHTATSKHAMFKINELVLESASGMTTGGVISLDSNPDMYSELGADSDGFVSVNAKVFVPFNYEKNELDIIFGVGTMLYTYPHEISQSGNIYIKDFKVTAGEAGTTEETTTKDTEVPTTKDTEVPTIANEYWNSYFGYNEGWYEGASGHLKNETDNSWTACLDTLGWGGVLGARVYRYRNINIGKGQTYTISFLMNSSNCDKWVYILIGNDENPSFADWVKLEAGKIVNYKKTFVAKENTDMLSFCIGGEAWDRDNVSADLNAKIRYSYFDSLGYRPENEDFAASTIITCDNFSLVSGNTETSSVPPESTLNQTTSSLNNATDKTETTKNIELSDKPVYTKKPGKVSIKKAVNLKGKKVKISLNKRKGVTGYEINYSTRMSFKAAKKIKTKKLTYIIKKLKKGKTYYIRVRAYKKTGKKNSYGTWSKVRRIRIKK